MPCALPCPPLAPVAPDPFQGFQGTTSRTPALSVLPSRLVVRSSPHRWAGPSLSPSGVNRPETPLNLKTKTLHPNLQPGRLPAVRAGVAFRGVLGLKIFQGLGFRR